MARQRLSAQQARDLLLEAAAAYLDNRRGGFVIVGAGHVEVLRPTGPPGRPPAEGLRGYELAIVRALTDTPVSSRRLARLAGRTHNSHFRSQLRQLVDAGHIRHTSRGYGRP